MTASLPSDRAENCVYVTFMFCLSPNIEYPFTHKYILTACIYFDSMHIFCQHAYAHNVTVPIGGFAPADLQC